MLVYTYDENSEHENVFDIYIVRADGEDDLKIAEVYDEGMAKLIVKMLNFLERRFLERRMR